MFNKIMEIMMKNKILVTGATGNIGSYLVPALLSEGADVRVLVRNMDEAKNYKANGAEVVTGDLDKQDTLQSAVSGVDKIYLLTWNGPTSIRQAENIIRAAVNAGNPHIVRSSGHGSEKSRIIRDLLAYEELIKSSGLTYTFLRPTFFMQNIFMAAQTISAQGTIYMPFKDGKVATIDVRDIAEAAAKVLTTMGHEGKTYILTGPQAVSFYEVAAAFSEVLDKEVKYVDVPLEAGKQAMLGLGMPEWIVDGYVELIAEFANNWANKAYPDFENLTGHKAHSIKQFAKDFESAFSESVPQNV
jgi:uncharacterized protein YbjT (DUF2867 family)